jgi:hypothetical protein
VESDQPSDLLSTTAMISFAPNRPPRRTPADTRDAAPRTPSRSDAPVEGGSPRDVALSQADGEP